MISTGNILTEEEGLQVLLDLKNAKVVSVKSPTPGMWTLHIGATGESTVRITGLSSFDFSHGFSRRSTMNLVETETRPVRGK